MLPFLKRPREPKLPIVCGPPGRSITISLDAFKGFFPTSHICNFALSTYNIMSITFIPQELVGEFIDILANEGDIDSLRTLSLISHSFVVRCRQHLFASINLQGSGANRAQSLLQKVERLYQVLLRAPEIANYTHTLSFWVYRFNATAACIISKLLLQFSMINTFILRSGTSSCNWTLIDPELRFAFSHLAYSPTLKKFTLLGLQSFPVTFFTGCTNITDLNFSYCSMTEDHGSLEKSERDSIAKLRNLTLCGHNRGVEKLICGRRQDGSPILDISHLQTIYTEVYRPEALLATKELLNGASEIVSLSIQCAQSTISMTFPILNFFNSQRKI